MNDVALILAAHGSRVDESTNAALWQMAAKLRPPCIPPWQGGRLGARASGNATPPYLPLARGEAGVFSEVTCAFHHGEPTFARVLDDVESARVVVVPIMTSEGYYSRVALPRELTRHETFSRRNVRITPPLGVHPAIPGLMQDRLQVLLRVYCCDSRSTSVAVIGHGTPRHPNSSRATYALAETLAQSGPCEDVFAAFLDEEPFVESVFERAQHDSIIVLLFLIAAGPHALVDVPTRLGLTIGALQTPPFLGKVNGRTVIVDEAIGSDPRIIPLVIDLARSAITDGVTATDKITSNELVLTPLDPPLERGEARLTPLDFPLKSGEASSEIALESR